MHDGTITTCNAMFYDDGGSDNNYSDNFSAILTFMPESENAKLQVTFNTFKTSRQTILRAKAKLQTPDI